VFESVTLHEIAISSAVVSFVVTSSSIEASKRYGLLEKMKLMQTVSHDIGKINCKHFTR